MTQEEDLDNPKELMWKADVIWTELAVSIGCGAAERTALQMLNKTTLPDSMKPEKPALKVEAIGSNLDPLDEMTSDIVAKIATVSRYKKIAKNMILRAVILEIYIFYNFFLCQRMY